ncbi:MAG: helix-turn-helix transcriptional regulator [Eubacteriales bacterium]|nr:helix-turn-helix transcriptional regulator [Eubacteriales bacterium]
MRNAPSFRQSKWTMKRKLFGYMLILALLLVVVLLSGLFMFDRFDAESKNTYEALDVQMEVFKRGVSTHLEHLAAECIRLSGEASSIIEEELSRMGLPFSSLTDDAEAIAALQEALIAPLSRRLVLGNCTGVFVMLEATVNSSLENAASSRTGLYLQQTGYDNSDESILLLRGLADTGKAHGLMPHRKWRLEFSTEFIPDYEQLIAQAALPLESSYRLTQAFLLPGTSDSVMLLTVPIFGGNGALYGLCGYEISASYFAAYHAQPTKLSRLTCLLAPVEGSALLADGGLSCGDMHGYHSAPRGALQMQSSANSLTLFSGEEASYIGLSLPFPFPPGEEEGFVLCAMLPLRDYERAVQRGILQNLILLALFLFFAASCCLFFSRRFLSPILRALEQIKSDDREGAPSPAAEIDDLFAFLAQKDLEHERLVHDLRRETQAVAEEKERLLSEFESAQSKYASAQVELSRLAYSRTQEIDPEDYSHFLSGIETLTPAERRVYRYYLEGKTVKEIIEIAQIKESTLRYHNRNIYAKLGVNSLKQLLRYAALMQQESDPA